MKRGLNLYYAQLEVMVILPSLVFTEGPQSMYLYHT